MKLLREYPDQVYLGTTLDNEKLYLSKPSWDCDWYWGFGYVGNKNLHTHLNYLHPDKILWKLKEVFQEDSFIIKDDKDYWLFCEYVASIYHLRKTAQFFYLGGSHIASANPLKHLLQNSELYTQINSELIPRLIDEVYKILEKYIE